MGRILLATIVGALVLFVWGFVYHATLGPTIDAYRSLEPGQEAGLVTALREHVPEQGAYFIPGMPDVAGMSAEDATQANEDWSARHEAGPLAMVIYNPDGRPAMAPMVFVKGLVVMLISTFIMSLMLRCGTPGGSTYVGRVGFVLMVAVFCAVINDAKLWVWFYFPTDYSLAQAADTVIGWLIVGIVMAAIVKPRPRVPKAEPATG
jgi:hypothetical protein